jgi:hypothetical protein
VSYQIGSSSCIYVSNWTLYPYPNGGTINNASDECAILNLGLAVLSPNEMTPFWNMLSKYILVGISYK